ncbi:T9SS type A sorting domain-containing protein [Polaribacter sp.]|uniref:T9SS type A sorting domain-containing protein n=1 Tax=Polaribacter sp. TaxID=1920175 RepID=UPI003F6ACE2D
MQNKNTLKKLSFICSFFFFLATIQNGIGQQLHQDCSPTSSKFSWSTNPSGNNQFNWPSGNLTNTLNNVDNSNVNVSFTFSGDTASLNRWQNSSSTTDSPAIGTDASFQENLQFYTSGFNNPQGVTITINFSEPVNAVGFDLLHINLGGASGDKFTVSATNTLNNTILPTFTNSNSPSYNSNETTGVVNAIAGSTNSNSWVGVNFSDTNRVSSITIQWQDCNSCTTGFLHGAGISGLSFCATNTNSLDTDLDTVIDVIDIDDDNDGILDIEEQNCENSNAGTVTNNNSFPVDNGVRNENDIADGINGRGAEFNNTNDLLVVNFGKEIPANTILKIQTFATNNANKTVVIEQSNANGNTTSNPVSISHNNGNNNSKNTDYVLTESTQYIKISMSVRNGGRIEVDFIEYQAYNICNDLDTDNDGTPNRLDLDSDNDGCPDTKESSVPANLIDFNGILKSIVDGNFGNNGYLDILENNDTVNATPNFTNSYNLYAINNNVNACGEVIITQVYQSDTDRWIEIKNIHPTAIVPTSTVSISIFLNKSSSNLTNVTPDARLTYTGVINPGEAFLFKNSNSTITNVKNGIGLVNNATLSNFNGGNDFIVLSKNGSNLNWDLRTDVVTNIPNNSSLVRSDLITQGNRNFTDSEWIVFVDDNLDPYRDLANGGPERHPHSPLLSEINTANTNKNTLLGEHIVQPTYRIDNNWSNGLPDRSRTVILSENFITSETLKANTLTLENTGKITINDALLVVNKNINLINSDNEIRLAGTSQLIQTHTENSKITGNGKLLIDRQTNVASIYRYTYMSSPVNTIGTNNFKVKDILKDGTSPISNTSPIVDINFVDGFNGSATSPISIADYWIYTYGSGDGTRSNYVQQKSTGTIAETDGFLMKGTGVNQNYTFVGTPKDGNLITAIGANESYLVGNPFASAINSKKFIEDNLSSISGTLYFWEHAGEQDIESSNNSGHNFGGYIGGYATRNISMGLAANQVSTNNKPNSPTIGEGSYKAPKQYIAVGQGFFVGGSNTGGNITFNNSQREYILEGDESVFFKSKTKKLTSAKSNTLPIIKLGMDYLDDNQKTLHRQIGISFNSNNTFKKDIGYDSELFDLNDTDMYWQFPEDEAKYAIAGVQQITPELKIPLTIEINYDGNITLLIDETNIDNDNIYLYDSLKEEYYQLLGNKIELNLIKGSYKERFFMTFSEEKSLSITDNIINDATIYYDTNNEEVTIRLKNNAIFKTVNIYTLLGQEIKNWSANKKDIYKTNISLGTRSKGVYIVKVATNKGTISKKILIN